MVQADSSVKGDRFERYSGSRVGETPWIGSILQSLEVVLDESACHHKKNGGNSFYDDEKPYYEHGETPGEVSVSF